MQVLPSLPLADRFAIANPAHTPGEIMRLSSLTALVAFAGILLVGGTAHASFVSYSLTNVDITASTLDSNGLPISTQVVPGLLPKNFTLGDSAPNQSTTFGLFDIWTTDNSIDGNDSTPRSISVTLTFATPPSGGSSGTLSGITAGVTGLVSYGQVTWNGPVTVDYGTGSYRISLSNETFNDSFFGFLDGGSAYARPSTRPLHR